MPVRAYSPKCLEEAFSEAHIQDAAVSASWPEVRSGPAQKEACHYPVGVRGCAGGETSTLPCPRRLANRRRGPAVKGDGWHRAAIKPGPLFALHAGSIHRSSCRESKGFSKGRLLSTLTTRCCIDPPARSAYYTGALLCGSPAGRPSSISTVGIREVY